MGVTVGIDSHKSSLAVAVLDDLGRPLGVREFANNPIEHENLRRWIASHGDARLIGVEGSGNFGAALTRHLLERGENVREVPAFLSHRERKKTPARGKSDPQDALAIARVAACLCQGSDSPPTHVDLTEHPGCTVCEMARLGFDVKAAALGGGGIPGPQPARAQLRGGKAPCSLELSQS